MFPVDLRSSVPLEEQIQGGLRQLVLKGRLKPGDKLPAPEELAQILLVSPAVVTRAYENLTKERFLTMDSSGGMTVALHAPGRASKELAEVVQQFIEAVESTRSEGLSWEEINSIVDMLKFQALPDKSQMIPGIFRRLYFDRSPGKGDAICPYCREAVKTDTVSCLICGTWHHSECWEETRHCSVFGCKGKVKLKS